MKFVRLLRRNPGVELRLYLVKVFLRAGAVHFIEVFPIKLWGVVATGESEV